MNIPVQNCSSCGACSNVCARNAISMQLDGEGFYRPVVDAKKCLQCGSCEKVCPWTNAVENPSVLSAGLPKTIAAFAKKESVRLESSSGGIFTVLAEKILDDGGVVVGVSQLSPTMFGHVVINNKVGLAKLRGSKYVQADAGLVYREVLSLLKSGKKVLFSGTPCQVAALYAVLGKNVYAGLITVDVVCHGTPSVKVFEKYVTEIEKENSAQVQSSQFRDKREGWRLYSMTSSLNTISGDCFQVSKTLHKDKFMRVFLQNICLNSSCADCKYGKLPRVADITLGDYWNIASVHPEMDDNKGISVVLLNTDNGNVLFDSVAESVIQCESKVEYAVAGNPCIVRSSKPHIRRSEFFANLDKYTLDELIKKYCPYPSPMKKMYFNLRGILGRIKRKMFYKNSI